LPAAVGDSANLLSHCWPFLAHLSAQQGLPFPTKQQHTLTPSFFYKTPTPIPNHPEKGLEPELRADAWPFLLGVFSPDTTYEDRRQQHALMVQQYQQLRLQCQALESGLRECMRPRDGGGPQGEAVLPAGFDMLQQQQLLNLQHQQQQQPGSMPQQQQPGAAGLAPFELPPQVVQFAEAHRIIVLDAVRTDFRRTAVAAIYSSAAAGALGGGLGFEEAVGAPPGAGSSLFGPPELLPAAAEPLVTSWVAGWLGGSRPSSPYGVGGGGQQRLWVSEAAQHVLDSSSHLSSEGRRQAARLIGLLSAYAVYDPETGYCQG